MSKDELDNMVETFIRNGRIIKNGRNILFPKLIKISLYYKCYDINN